MEENRKRPGSESADDEFDGKRAKPSAISKDAAHDDDDLSAWLSPEDDERANELAKLLETEISSPVKVKFADNPYTWPLIFQSSSSSYVTINGNEESCGSSFSDLDSSVMVSVDMRGIDIARVNIGIDSFPMWFQHNEKATEEEEEEYLEGSSGKGLNGSDCFDCVDYMLARFLGEDIFKC